MQVGKFSGTQASLSSMATPAGRMNVQFGATRPKPFQMMPSPLQDKFNEALAANTSQTDALNQEASRLLTESSAPSSSRRRNVTVHCDQVYIGIKPGTQDRVLRGLKNLGFDVPVSGTGNASNYISIRLDPEAEGGKLNRGASGLQAQWEMLQEWADQAGEVRFISPLMKEKDGGYQQVLTEEISIRFDAVPTKADLKRLEEKLGLTVVKPNEYVKQQFLMKQERTSWTQILVTAARLSKQKPEDLGKLKLTLISPNFYSEYRR